MNWLRSRFNRADMTITDWLARYGLVFLRVSLGLVIGATLRGGAVIADPEVVQSSSQGQKAHV